MNISEFERTKPIETMRALNTLIKKVETLVDNDDDDDDIDVNRELLNIWEELKDIKEKLKKGK
jgi:hypothetical protein